MSKVNTGFTEVTNTSPLTSIATVKVIELGDLLYFCEANGYCWNYAHDLLWRHDGKGLQEGLISLELMERYHPLCAEIIRRFFKVYNLRSVYLAPKNWL